LYVEVLFIYNSQFVFHGKYENLKNLGQLSPLPSKKHAKYHNLCHPLTKQMQTSKLRSTTVSRLLTGLPLAYGGELKNHEEPV
jgi:hypothetical protein